MTTDSLIEDARDIAQENVDEFWRLARAAAMGEEITAQQIADACIRSGKRVDEYKSAVRSLEKRRKDREDIAGLQAVEDEFMQLRDRILELEQKRDAFATECNLQIRALAERKNILQQDSARRYVLKNQLSATGNCPDASLRARVKWIERDQQKNAHAIRSGQDRIEAIRVQMSQAPNADKARFATAIENVEGQIKALEQQGAELSDNLAEVTREMEQF